jgi:hypothetical protein
MTGIAEIRQTRWSLFFSLGECDMKRKAED